MLITKLIQQLEEAKRVVGIVDVVVELEGNKYKDIDDQLFALDTTEGKKIALALMNII